MTNKPNVFCHAPWTNIEILPTGAILPCCKFQVDENSFNIKRHTINEYRTSKYLEEIKTTFKQGQWPHGCERCRLEEQSGVPSKRQLDHDRWRAFYDSYDLSSNTLLTASLALGNVCNLKCIICNPHASSKWRKEFFDIYRVDVADIGSIRDDVIDQLIGSAPNLLHLDFHGGEPLLSNVDQHWNLLDHFIETGRSQQITLHYTTNGSIWPDSGWFARWQHFHEIDLQISIDGVAKRFEYLRFPADWYQVSQNVIRFRDYQTGRNWFRISIAHTVSAFNIFYLDEFVTWCYNQQLPKPWTGKLHNPDMLRPTIWPEPAKQHIIQQLSRSQWPEVHTWANMIATVDDSHLFESFLNRINQHDAYRETSFKITFPEMAIYT